MHVWFAVGNQKQRFVLQLVAQADAQPLGSPYRGIRIAQTCFYLCYRARHVQVIGQVRHFMMQLIENFALRRRRLCAGLSGSKRAQPIGRARQRLRKSPADKNQRQPSDQKRLEQGIEQGIAKRARDLLVDVTCVVEESDGPRDFATAVERQSGDVHRNPLLRIVERELVGRQKFTNSSVLFCGTCGRFGADPENRRKSRGDGECADRKSTRLNSSHSQISYAVFCLKKKKKIIKSLTAIKKKKSNTSMTA